MLNDTYIQKKITNTFFRGILCLCVCVCVCVYDHDYIHLKGKVKLLKIRFNGTEIDQLLFGTLYNEAVCCLVCIAKCRIRTESFYRKAGHRETRYDATRDLRLLSCFYAKAVRISFFLENINEI